MVKNEHEGLFSFKGKIGRLRYFLTILPGGILIGILHSMLNASERGSETGFKLAILLLATILINFPIVIAATVKRLRDLNKSPQLILLGLLPVVNLFFIFYLIFLKWNEETSRYEFGEATQELSDYIKYLIVLALLILTILAGFLLIDRSNPYIETSNDMKTVVPAPIEPPKPPTPKVTEHIWFPDQIYKPPQKILFNNGGELVAEKNDRQFRAQIKIRKKAGMDLIDSDIEDDFVEIAGVLPSVENPILAIIKSSCSGVACSWSNYYIAQIIDGNLETSFIASIYNKNFTFVLNESNHQIVNASIIQAKNGDINEYGDLQNINLKLVTKNIFVHRGFSSNFISLINANPQDFFQHSIAREKLAHAMGLSNFRQLREFSNGPGDSNLVLNRYIVFNGCQVHFCDTRFASIVLDGLTGDAWSIMVDRESGRYFVDSTKPWTKDLLNTFKPAIKLKDFLEPIFENGQIKLILSKSP